MLDYLLEILSEGNSISLWFIFFILLACGLGLPVPEDIPIVVSGIMISEGTVHFKHAMIVCMSGVLIGDSIIYWLGRLLGNGIFDNRIVRKLIKPSLVKYSSKAFEKYGSKIIFIGRFIPGFRAPIFFFIGKVKKPYWLFIAIDGFAALISVPLWIYVGKVFGDNIPALEKAIKEMKTGTFFLILFLITLLFVGNSVKKRFKKKILEKE